MRQFSRALLCLFMAASVLTSSGGIIGNSGIHAHAEEERQTGNLGLTDESIYSYKETYKSLSGRITDRGYAATSLTGAYSGMFPRDSSIEALAMMQYGDLENAKKILNFLLTYNQGTGLDYMAHILDGYQDDYYGNDYLIDPARFGGEESYYSQRASARALYMLNAPNNKAAQPFSVPFDSISSVRADLGKTNNTDKVIVKILSDYTNPDSVIASQEYTFGEHQNGWQEIIFDQPVGVIKNKRYYLEIQAPEDSGKVVWNGIDSGGSFQAINYDRGWNNNTGNITAFEIISGDQEAPADPGFYSQESDNIDLYLLNAPNNKAAQPFRLPFARVTAVKAYLTRTNDTDKVTAKILRDYTDPSSVVAEQEYTFGEHQSGWQEIKFDQPVTLEKDTMYYLEIQASEDSGNVVWKGGDGHANFLAINYDLAAHSGNGWRVDSQTTAFQIVPDLSISDETAGLAQSFQLDVAGAVKGVQVRVDAEQAGGNLIAELKSDLDGPALKTASAGIDKSGENTYRLSFDGSVACDAHKNYFVVLSAEENDGRVEWRQETGETKGWYQAYDNDGTGWAKAAVSLSLTPLRVWSESLQLGGSAYATQEIPVFSSETVTAVKVRVGKRENAAGKLIGRLYKKDGVSLQYVDEATASLDSTLDEDEVTFRFGLPLEKVGDKAGNYVLLLSAPDAAAGSVIWYGTEDTDRYETTLFKNGTKTVISGDASFTAYRSAVRILSQLVQVDGHYMVVLAWAKFAEAAKEHPEYQSWIEASYPLAASLANYYIETNDLVSDEMNLVYNPSIEHTRNTQYHKGYDLITNVFLSQSMYEMSAIARRFGDTANAEKWDRIDRQITEGIYDNLTSVIDGRIIYSEMYGSMDYESGAPYYIKGFSWINMAPMAAGWHAMDTEIMESTLEVYGKFGSTDYNGFTMLDACIFLNKDETGLNTSAGAGGLSRHVIGKGWSWQLMYYKSQNDLEKVDTLIGFSLAHPTPNKVYTESWWQNKPGEITFSDPGNQEHASWQHYAMSTVYPTLTKAFGIHPEKYNALSEQAGRLKEEDYTGKSWSRLQTALENGRAVLAEQDLLQAEVDNIAGKLDAAMDGLILIGDVNGDGTVSPVDVMKIRKLMMEDTPPTAGQLAAGDFDGDGKLNAVDIMLLRKKLLTQ